MLHCTCIFGRRLFMFRRTLVLLSSGQKHAWGQHIFSKMLWLFASLYGTHKRLTAMLCKICKHVLMGTVTVIYNAQCWWDGPVVLSVVRSPYQSVSRPSVSCTDKPQWTKHDTYLCFATPTFRNRTFEVVTFVVAVCFLRVRNVLVSFPIPDPATLLDFIRGSISKINQQQATVEICWIWRSVDWYIVT